MLPRLFIAVILLLGWPMPAVAQGCTAIGAIRVEPPNPAPGTAARIIAEVDSPDDACRTTVRSEPFAIIQPGNGEVSLTREGDSFTGTFTAPTGFWTLTLYVVGTGDAVASVAPSLPAAPDKVPGEDDPGIVQWYRRSPGAVLIAGGGLLLAVLAIAGSSLEQRRRPRWQVLLGRRIRAVIVRRLPRRQSAKI